MKDYENTGIRFLQRTGLFFLIGFFAGASIYYLFRNSFTGLMAPFLERLNAGQVQDYSLLRKMVHAVWNHGKFFALFWIFSLTKFHRLYPPFFLIYTGFCSGFLVFLFVMEKGIRGIVLYFATVFPQALLFVPVWLFCIAWADGRRRGAVSSVVPGTQKNRRRRVGITGMLVTAFFFAACYLEARYNVFFVGLAL